MAAALWAAVGALTCVFRKPRAARADSSTEPAGSALGAPPPHPRRRAGTGAAHRSGREVVDQLVDGALHVARAHEPVRRA